jgi:5-(carboxyamino)imidazole ribonucleotide mutase
MLPENELIGAAILLGSESDIETMKPCFDKLKEFSINFLTKIASAHRTPEDVDEFIKECIGKGCMVFIAAAGMAAHLPGVVASKTVLPVIGVPLASKTSLTAINGLDAILSILQMPSGIPVATVTLNGAVNAAYLALQIIGTSDPELRKVLVADRLKKAGEVRESNKKLKNI